MSVKDDTNNILREHNKKLSQTSLIPITVSIDNQDKCKKRPRTIEVKKTMLNRYSCNICTYSTTQKGILKKHQSILPTGIRSYIISKQTQHGWSILLPQMLQMSHRLPGFW